MTHPIRTDEPTAEAPKRMTMGRVVELLLQRGSSNSSSVTLTRNAKGETQIEVVVRTDDEHGIDTPGEASAVAETIYDALRAKYPFGAESGTTGGAA
jgi:hypothetical protein